MLNSSATSAEVGFIMMLSANVGSVSLCVHDCCCKCSSSQGCTSENMNIKCYLPSGERTLSRSEPGEFICGSYLLFPVFMRSHYEVTAAVAAQIEIIKDALITVMTV